MPVTPVFAQAAAVPAPLILAIVLGLLLFSMILVFARRYKRCPSNRLMVIYGKTGAGAAKCIHGGAAFVWPLFQDYEYLPLDPFVVPIDLSNALSMENIRVSVPTTVTVAISTHDTVKQNAAVRLLGLTPPMIRDKAQDIILGQMRAVIATMKIEDINSDRQAFMSKVNDAVATELVKIGLEVINTNIKDIDDESGYIKALGRKAAAEAIQQADIDVSEAKKRGEIGVAERERDRRKAVAEATAEAEIGEAEADRQKRIAVAEAIAKAEVGEAESQRTKRQGLATYDAEAVKTEATADANKATYRAGQRVAEEKARGEAEAAARTADGRIRVAEEHAQKQAEEARSAREEARLRAEVVVPAEAARERVRVEAEAEKVRATVTAEGDAEAHLARARADAAGVQAVLDAKAEGYKGLLSGVRDPQALGALLLIEKIDALAGVQAEAVRNLPLEKIIVWDGGGDGEGLSRLGKQLLGVLPPLHDLAAQAGLELPDFLGRIGAQAARGGAASVGEAAPPPAPTPPEGIAP